MNSDSYGASFIPILTYNACIKYDKERRNLIEEKTVLRIQKRFNAILKNGFNPVLGSIPRLPLLLLKAKFDNKMIFRLHNLRRV